MHESRKELIDISPLAPAGFQRTIGFLKFRRRRVEQGHHREIDLCMAVITGRIHQRGELHIPDADVSYPHTIRRASCKEHVCEYVYISVFAVSFTKTQTPQ